MRFTKTVLIILLGFTTGSSCLKPKESLPVFQQAFIAFDTIVTITITDPVITDNQFQQIMIGIKNLTVQYDLIFNKYNPQSEIAKLNKKCSGHDIKLSSDLYQILLASKKYYFLSERAFDITIGRITRLYNFPENIIPPEKDLQENLKYIGMDKIILTNQTITYLQSGIHFDLGGIAKGYIIDRLTEYLYSLNFKNFIINIGGDLYAAGCNPQKRPWSIGIQNPRDINSIIDQISLSDRAVITSGDYERYTIRKNKRYHHILNPKTGLPVWNNIVSVTLIGEKALDITYITKAVFVLGKEEGIRLINKNYSGKVKYIIFLEKNNSLERYDNL